MNIFDIKRYAINDGPGIRTTVFVKGCPLRCVWCHNPEGWTAERQILYKQSRCIGCKTCVETCPAARLELTADGIRPTGQECTLCGKCSEECPTTALEMCGREWPMDELMGEIEKERAIMEDSGGGVTLCGGEPLMHPMETMAILRELGRRGFHRTVDTTLYAQPDVVDSVAAECELLLIDLKLMDSAKHRLYTGVPNDLIVRNIRRVAEAGHSFQIRIPLIEGINADGQNMESTAEFLNDLSLSGKVGEDFIVNLLPYHDVGKDKHRRMWSQYNPQGYPMATPTEETLQRCRRQLESHALRVVIGG